MQISLKSVRISESLSEETTAFTARLYVDGKATADVRNSGHGGCNDYDTYAMPDREDARNRLAAATAAARQASGWEYDPLDGFVEHLLFRADPRMRRWAKRMKAAGMTCLFDRGEGRWEAGKGTPPPSAHPITYFDAGASIEIDRATAEACDLIL